MKRVEHAIAYSTLALTVGLAVSRPRIGRGELQLRVTPGIAAVLGVFLLLFAGLLPLGELATSARLQWRPLLALTSMMVMTGVVKEVGAFERIALRIEAYARSTSPARAFDLIFAASVLTPTFLNNDAAILLLTPVVVALARKLYPENEKILEAFAFAVFLAPGVAPLIISNPMNMIAAELAGLNFNSYARIMVPISAAGAIATFLVLRGYYRRAFDAADRRAPALPKIVLPTAHPAEKPAFLLLLAVFASYPLIAAYDAPVWPVAVAGAFGTVAIAHYYRAATPRKIAGHISFDILAFLWGVFLVAGALKSVGVIDQLAALYQHYRPHPGQEIAVVGVVSALGSAIVDNHPMMLLNMLALEGHHDSTPVLAALIGGDIGPRLLPIGSLAGLLWMELLRRRGVEIGIGRFVRLGTLALIPALTVSLVLLWILSG